MIKITFVEFNGLSHEVTAQTGQSVMQVALSNMVPGIIADCGGNCACATCHVYIGESWKTSFNPPSTDEVAMIECALHVTADSRLSCQLPVTPEMNGMVVHLPESQT